PGLGGSREQVTAARVAAGLPAQQQEVATRDVTQETVQWSTGINYQQRLIGSTTLTPSLRLSGQALRHDTLSAASGFVSAPMRLSFGARLKTDLYGFYPGFASFERIRHKLSPSFTYDYSPEVTPNELQRQVFGSRGVQARNVLSINLNQTIEAKVEQDGDAGGEDAEARDAETADSLAADAAGTAAQETAAGTGDEGLRRLETGRTVSILNLQTSATTYDFVQADSAGEFLAGFTTTTLSNSVSSDFLRGLSLQLTHDLFDVEEPAEGGGAPRPPGAGRTFDPHLSSMNLSFSFGSSSALFQKLGLFTRGEEPGEAVEPGTGEGELQQEEDPFAPASGTDETSVVPGGLDGDARDRTDGGDSGDVGTWNAGLSFALQRPREETLPSNQMLQANLRFHPTEFWDVSWRTSYDVEAGRFNDHIIRLTRDLHRWQANFDFLQTATGNWTFRFEVSLIDNRDLKFDYEQRSRLGR
ncbi:MAG: hypothetical protein GWM92_11255, partial [Gemmatimonadetes bacterium]|nr:hypothetical protein [Gemmatimonadota bacterium]NIR77829.1 hypothetical protein [Gemmatimonadota bacterium]NIT87929.1 hypothetical protein [Gemmatimonadota bacterium]NIU31786.1 hypothetical protein [Gemmatimonadota bacterium]NIU35119.1 hypothetical protein [Gemmatimonadota bacterium]